MTDRHTKTHIIIMTIMTDTHIQNRHHNNGNNDNNDRHTYI